MQKRTIGALLAEARRESGLSQDDAADLLGVTRQRVSSVERSASLRVETLRRYASAYGVSARSLAAWISEEALVDA